MANLTFLGASGTVTGSKYLLEAKDKKVLIDCGLFQGLKDLRLLNWQPPTFDPSGIHAVFLTHGHLDHTGYLPRLVKLGFKGRIYATPPTLEIAKIILEDSAKIQEEEADRSNREGYSKHKPALPLYDLKDVEQTLKLFFPVQEGVELHIEDLHITFQYNGHILGSTFIEVEIGGKTLVFSGDLGRRNDLILYPPKKPKKADILLMETTYGGKVHPDEASMIPELQSIVNETINRGGTLFIPSFAVERAQLLMLMLWRLASDHKIPHIPMIMDSPMGANMLKLFHNSQAWHRIPQAECSQMCSHFQMVNSFSDTLQLRRDKRPKVIIAGSGMMTGGRILSYLEEHANSDKDTLLFVGFQAEGTRGRKLLDGDKYIKMYGKDVPFRMQIKQLDGLSAHGDQNDLLDWLSDLEQQPSKIFLVHGEQDQAEAFQKKLKDTKQWDAEIPQLNHSLIIED